MSAIAGTSETPLIVNLLIEQEVLRPDELTGLKEALAQYPDSLEEALIRSGMVPDGAVSEAYSRHSGLPCLELSETDGIVRVHDPVHGTSQLGSVSDLANDLQAVARRISENLCRKWRVAPVSEADGVLSLACLNPYDFEALEEVQMHSRCIVEPLASPLGLLDALVGKLFGERDLVREIAVESNRDEAAGGGGGGDEDGTEFLVDLDRPVAPGKENQVVIIVNTLLRNAIELGASDIHIEPYEDNVRVRCRIDGELEEVTSPPKPLFIPTVSRLKILSKMDIAEKRVPQDGAIALRVGDARVDLRVNTVPTVFGEKMCLRILAKGGIPESLQLLGFKGKQETDFLEAANAPHGLIFVTGPTGSGKSTTLYTCLNLINIPTVNISTAEDPVEYKFEGMNQVHVRAHVGLTFLSALRAFLRQDPDIIMVGEVRDQETATICLRAALTGHLVLSTLHTNSSLEVINRLVDMGVEPFLLGPALRLLEAQRLARRLCSECKIAYEVPEDVALRYGIEPGITLYRAGEDASCKKCGSGGYKGRVGVYEVVPISEPLRLLIMKGNAVQELQAQAKGEGVDFLADSARKILIDGSTSLEEASDFIRPGGSAH